MQESTFERATRLLPSGHHKLALNIAVLTLIADQLSKFFVIHVINLPSERSIEFTSWFNLSMVWNPGVSFGFLRGGGPALMIAMTGILTIALAVWWWRTRDRWTIYPLALIIGGSLGNIFDRFRYGAVADFLDFHLDDWHYPAFNLADSAIVLGVVFMLYSGFRKTDDEIASDEIVVEAVPNHDDAAN